MFNTILFNLIKNDSPEPWETFLQDNAISQMEGLEELHNNIMFYLAIILFALSWIIVLIIINFKNKIISNIQVKKNNLIFILKKDNSYDLFLIIPVVLIMLIIISATELLLQMGVIIDPPTLLINGESNDWDWKSQNTNYIDIEKQPLTCHMDINSIINHDALANEPWLENIPHNCQHAKYLRKYKGLSLKDAGITLSPHGPKTRINFLTWYMYEVDRGAFFAYEKETTTITEYYIYRASILPNVPDSFLAKHKINSIGSLP